MWYYLLAVSVGSWCILFALTAGEIIDCIQVKPPKKREFSEERSIDLRQRNIAAPAVIAIVTGLFVGVSSTFFYNAITRGDWKYPDSMDVTVLNSLLGILLFLIALIAVPVLAAILIKGDGSPRESAQNPFRIYSAAQEYLKHDGRGAVKLDVLKNNLNEWEYKIGNYAVNVESGKDPIALFGALDETASKRGIRFAFGSAGVYWLAVRTFLMRFSLIWIHLAFSVLGVIAFLLSQWNGSGGDWYKLILVVIVAMAVNGLTVLVYACARGGRAVRWYSIYDAAVAEARREIERAEQAGYNRDNTPDAIGKINRSLEELTKAVERLSAVSRSYSLRSR